MENLIKPEKLVLTVCRWVKLHADRENGDFSYLKMGDDKFALLDFQFEQWHFRSPSVDFFLEFSRNFLDRVVTIEETTCEKCKKELDREMNIAIIEAHGVPPQE